MNNQPYKSPIIQKTDLSSINSMKKDLSIILWDEVLACEDIDNAYSKFIHSLKNAYENNRISKRRINKKNIKYVSHFCIYYNIVFMLEKN